MKLLQFLKKLFKKKEPPKLIEGPWTQLLKPGLQKSIFESYKIDKEFFFLDGTDCEWYDPREYIIGYLGTDPTVDSPLSSQHSTVSSQLHSQESEKELSDDPYQIPKKEQEQ